MIRRLQWLIILLGLLATQRLFAVLPEAETICLQEPVYQGRVCYHQINRNAPQTIVLVHGIDDNASDDWMAQWEALAKHYHVIAVDLPGYGASERATKLYTPDGYADVLQFVVEREVEGSFHLVGHSMGGAIALLYAAAHPGRIDRLVVIDAAGILHRLSLLKHLVSARLAAESGPSERLQNFTGKLLEELERFISPNTSEHLEQIKDLSGYSVQHVNSMTLIARDFSRVLVQLQQPTLLVWGENDPVAPVRTAHVLMHRLKNARLLVVADGDHVPMKSRPDLINNALLDFFRGEEPTGLTPIQELSPEPGERIGRCDRSRWARFSGYYRRIEIRNCSGVVLDGVVAEEVEIFESRVQIVNTRITGETVALKATGSEVKLTAVEIKGKVAIHVDRSRLDLAAVDIRGKEAAVQSRQDSKLIFSLCHIVSPRWQGDLHGFRAMKWGSQL